MTLFQVELLISRLEPSMTAVSQHFQWESINPIPDLSSLLTDRQHSLSSLINYSAFLDAFVPFFIVFSLVAISSSLTVLLFSAKTQLFKVFDVTHFRAMA